MTALRGAAVVELLATHALAGQRVVGGFEGVVRGLRRLRGLPLNATTTEDYTRCVFQKGATGDMRARGTAQD